MPSSPSDKGPDQDGRIPRAAIIVVVAGLVVSALIYAISFLPGSGSLEIDWDTDEPIASPPAKTLGDGSFAVSRTRLSALAPNEDGVLIYRVAGVVSIDSGGRKVTRVRCDVKSQVEGDTRMARSVKLRAAWPKPSEALGIQEVPETSFVKFTTGDSKKIDLPIRDVVQRYTDSSAPTEVKWDGYVEDDQNWIWKMPDGTGPGTATLPWLVIFESETRPEGMIDCVASVGAESTQIKVPFRQDEWPITDDQPNSDEVDTGDASNVE
ncbi:MAG: hypothetical protein QG596_562 [Actinomycetota bacterium]|jgi:hypothetical protein|nr:hypothetical protein [Actinomycetota bacterium]